MLRANRSEDPNVTRLPEQTFGSTYDTALASHTMLWDEQACDFWLEEDVEPLAESALGRMLCGTSTNVVPYGEWGPCYVELETRLGTMVGEGECWAHALARALAAYAEIRQRSKLQITEIRQKDANAFIADVHRHHKPPAGDKFRLGAYAVVNEEPRLVGVVVVGRPVSRHLDDGQTLEVTRLAVLEGGQNLCSQLYSAAWKEAKKRGYCHLITYVLSSEPATSKASGWTLEKAEAGGGSWSRTGRRRTDRAPTETKQRWGRRC